MYTPLMAIGMFFVGLRISAAVMPRISVPSCKECEQIDMQGASMDTYEGISSVDEDGPETKETAFGSCDAIECYKCSWMVLNTKSSQRMHTKSRIRGEIAKA